MFYVAVKHGNNEDRQHSVYSNNHAEKRYRNAAVAPIHSIIHTSYDIYSSHLFRLANYINTDCTCC